MYEGPEQRCRRNSMMCPGPEQAAAYADGRLDAADAARYLEHCSECEECRRTLALLSLPRETAPVPADREARAISALRRSLDRDRTPRGLRRPAAPAPARTSRAARGRRDGAGRAACGRGRASGAAPRSPALRGRRAPGRTRGAGRGRRACAGIPRTPSSARDSAPSRPRRAGRPRTPPPVPVRGTSCYCFDTAISEPRT